MLSLCLFNFYTEFSLVQFSHSVTSNSLWSHGLQYTRLPCPSPTPGAYSNSCPSSWWMPSNHLILYCPLLLLPSIFPSIRVFSNELESSGQCIEALASASALPINIQDWFPLGLTGLISLQSRGLSRVFSSTTVWKHQFFDIQPSLRSNSHSYMTTGKTIAWLYGPL